MILTSTGWDEKGDFEADLNGISLLFREHAEGWLVMDAGRPSQY